MDSLKDVFQIKESNFAGDASNFTYNWKVPSELPYFKGHFPGNPVLPGVAILDLITVLFNIHLAKEHEFLSIKSAKFADIIRPNEDVVCRFQFNESTSFWNGELKNQEEKLLARIRFQLAATSSSTNV